MGTLRRLALVATALLLTFASAAEAQQRSRARKDDAPKVGDAAPHFTAKFVGQDKTLELKKAVEKAKKPIVLLFGSYT